MNILDQLMTLSASERSRRLERSDTHQALAALGKDAAIEWLENHIESPIGPGWGWTLYYLKAEWAPLSRWVRLSKLHCLAAIDAIQMFAAATDGMLALEVEPKLPDGATPKSINEAVAFALAQFGNPRLEKAAQRIRSVWSTGPREPRKVSVPDALARVANILFRQDENLMNAWIKSMERSRERPEGPFDIYDNLLNFAEKKDILAIVDWRAPAEEIQASLSTLKGSEGLNIPWKELLNHPGDNEELFHAINTAISFQNQSLVCLDHGCDDNPLAFLPFEKVSEIRTLIASFDDPSVKLVTFQ
jgi:hypothetical protein